ncbi:hypothetical protein PRNP1_012832 [Phytophthora ramorum]
MLSVNARPLGSSRMGACLAPTSSTGVDSSWLAMKANSCGTFLSPSTTRARAQNGQWSYTNSVTAGFSFLSPLAEMVSTRARPHMDLTAAPSAAPTVTAAPILAMSDMTSRLLV